MRILLWHGWLLEGTGSNIYTAKVAEAWRHRGHEVLIVCQQGHPDRFPFVDAWGSASGEGVSSLQQAGATGDGGSAILLRPDIGSLLPVFVYDEYEGFRVKRFVDLTDQELETYLDRNTAALRGIEAWRPSDAVIAGHAMAGPVVARRAEREGRYVAKVHGSDLEYAARLQERYADLARWGLEGARAVAGGSRDVLARAVAVAPSVKGRTWVVHPGVDVQRWVPRPRSEALRGAAQRLASDSASAQGRPSGTDGRVRELLAARDPEGLSSLAASYDQTAPDPGAPRRLGTLADWVGPMIGYLGKLVPQKGVERFVQALALLGGDVRGVVVGFGTFREWLAALVSALDQGDQGAAGWLGEASDMIVELSPQEVRDAAGLAGRVTFTGRLDHRYAPEVVAGLDVLVVPSTGKEAFGMVAAEAAAAGALPLVARHSSLAEVAQALEGSAGTPGLLSFEPGPGSTHRLAQGLELLLGLPAEERAAMREAVRGHVVSEWTWDRTADRLLAASGA
jgi:glycosyltransferase involved in cell wall biosynthesis